MKRVESSDNNSHVFENFETERFHNGYFLVPAFLGSLAAVLVGLYGTVSDQLTVVGTIVSSVFGMQLSYLRYCEKRDAVFAKLLRVMSPPRELVENPDYLALHRRMTSSIAVLAGGGHGTLHELAYSSLTELNSQISEMANGRLIYEHTETWRTAYEQLLENPAVTNYRSVAWFRGADYWQDVPGQQSTALNCRLADQGLLVHRVVIVADNLWPSNEPLPRTPVLEWIEQQHVHGILIRLVRESQLAGESELAMDFGLYGNEAVGFQIVGETGKTIRFELDFREDVKQIAVQCWDRINLFSVLYRDLLDQLQEDS